MVFFIPGPSLAAEKQGLGLKCSIENEIFKPRMKLSSENEIFVRGGMVFSCVRARLSLNFFDPRALWERETPPFGNPLARESFAILSLQVSCDMKSIAAGPLRSRCDWTLTREDCCNYLGVASANQTNQRRKCNINMSFSGRIPVGETLGENPFPGPQKFVLGSSILEKQGIPSINFSEHKHFAAPRLAFQYVYALKSLCFGVS